MGHFYTATAIALDPSSPFYGQRIYAEALGAGRVALPLLGCAELVGVTFRLGQDQPSLLAVVDGKRARDGDQVALADGTLELAAPLGQRSGPRPRLVVLALPEGDLQTMMGRVWLPYLPVDEQEGHLLFTGVPPGARLRLEAGPGREMELSSDPSGTTRLAWPFEDP